MTICGLSRANEKDIRSCYDAVKAAPRKRIHTFLGTYSFNKLQWLNGFLATSDIHLEHKLCITRDECIEKSAKAVTLAASLGKRCSAVRLHVMQV